MSVDGGWVSRRGVFGQRWTVVLFAVVLVAAVVLGIHFSNSDDTPRWSDDTPITEIPFRIVYRNQTKTDITVWMEGSQPPCSLAQAPNCNTWLKNGEDNQAYTDKWYKLANVFKRSGTAFFVGSQNASTLGDLRRVAVLNHVSVRQDEMLLIIPPLDAQARPEWRFANWDGQVPDKPVGIKSWATPIDVDMPAAERVLLYEFNFAIQDNGDHVTYWDLSAVDGINANATMRTTAPTQDHYLNESKCETNIEAGCLYPGWYTCQNLKFQSADEDVFNKDTNVLEDTEEFNIYWNACDNLENKKLAEAESGDSKKKACYHLYWANDDHAQGYLNWLQREGGQADGVVISNAYGWAYDEFRWKDGTFDDNGNPRNGENDEIDAIRTTKVDPNPVNQTLEVDITYLITDEQHKQVS